MKTPEQAYQELLVVRSQGGDAAALDELVRRWNPRIWRYARSFADTDDGAWDIVQDSWMTVVRQLDDLIEATAFPCWLFRIVHRRAIDALRRKQRRRRFLGRYEEARETQPAPRADDVREEALTRALESLTPEQRALIRLYYFEELSLSEIGDVLSIPSGTVKSRLYHCRHALRRRMEEVDA